MVKILILRHAQSELNALKDKTFKFYNLKENEVKLCLAYKFLNTNDLIDANITPLGEAQCQISRLKNLNKFPKVMFF